MSERYWEQKSKANEASACRMATHCSGDCPLPYLAIESSVIAAARGCPERVESLAIGPDWDAKLAEYVALMGITPPAEKPGWHLVSYWG